MQVGASAVFVGDQTLTRTIRQFVLRQRTLAGTAYDYAKQTEIIMATMQKLRAYLTDQQQACLKKIGTS